MVENDQEQNSTQDESMIEKREKLLYQRNFQKFGLNLNLTVTLGVGLFVLLFSTYALVNIEHANNFFFRIQSSIIENFDWFFVLSGVFFIVVCFCLGFSKLGRVRLGGVHATPDFSDFGWYSMLISAGMGVGLVFWSVGEPLQHISELPPIFDSSNVAKSSIATTFFHWGIHPWGIYALISLALAFFAYNKQLPISFRSVFYPLLKDRIFGLAGDLIDIVAVLATLFGLATSLGLGVQQINSGLNFLLGVPFNTIIQIFLIIGIGVIASLSVLSGIDKGVQFLSKLNMRIAGILIAVIFILGPTGYIIATFSGAIGLYINDFIQSSFFISHYDKTWQGSWSIFYLAWWISWSPFVGMFIARISKGRTVKQLIFGVLIVPSILSFLWLSVFGGTAIWINEKTSGDLLIIVQENLPVALFEMLAYFSQIFMMGTFVDISRIVLSVIATVLIIIYFITSFDSGSLVIAKITSGGIENSPTKQKVSWVWLQGIVSATLLVIGGEVVLETLQTAVIASGLPFAIVLILMSVSLIKALKISYQYQKKVKRMDGVKKIADGLKVIEEEDEEEEDTDVVEEEANTW